MQNYNAKIGQIFIELTNACSFDCAFCPNDKMTRKKGFMDPKLAKKLIDEISEKKISNQIAFFLMGEPLLYPHLFEILSYAVDKGLKVTLSTNGNLLTDETIVKLLEIPMDILQISLQTPTKESFKIRRASARFTFEGYISHIKDLLKRKLKTGGPTKLSILIMDTRPNITQLLLNGRNTLNLNIDHKKAKELINDFIETCGSKPKKDNLLTSVSSNTKRLISGNYRICLPGNIELNFGSLHNWGDVMTGAKVYPALFGSCNALVEQFAVLWNGDYSLCCKDYNGDLIIGNANQESLTEILNSKKVKSIRNAFRNCRLPFSRCKLCRGGTNLPELVLKQIFTSVAYNVPFVFRILKKMVLK